MMAEKSAENSLKVGAVLVSADEKTVLSTWSNVLEKYSWSDALIDQAVAWGITNASALYLTINTYDKVSEKFHLNKVLEVISVDMVYIGLPDPNVCNYMNSDPILRMDNVSRYSDKYQREILDQNNIFFNASDQSISNSPYYHYMRISNLIIDKLTKLGISVTKEKLNEHKSKAALKMYIADQFGIELALAESLVNEAIFEAFNKKYGTYEYANDTRSLDTGWKRNFNTALNQVSSTDISKCAVVDVGVGGGHEAASIFANCTNITFVDVAIDGLMKVQKSIPVARIVNASADDMHVLDDKCFDIYVSLRTYNSSFFDIERAIAEAKRILKENAVIVVSVANGFLCTEKKCIIPGLLVPGTDFVDLYRGLDTARSIKGQYISAGFKDINLCPTTTEIYLTAKVA